MTEPLPFERCLDVIDTAASALATRATKAGLDAPVATCPGWTVADLVAHQGMIHRWAMSNLRLDGAPTPSGSQFLAEVPADELVDWFRSGARELRATLLAVAPDVPAKVFLNDAPRPRDFWARRQAHETTIHSVDALAAALGRLPSAAEAGIDPDVALDGIDELVTGFFTRGRSKLADETPYTIALCPTDSQRRWTLHIADGPMVTERREQADASAIFLGTAAQLYLGLWNRGTEIRTAGRPGALERWREVQHVRWSGSR